MLSQDKVEAIANFLLRRYENWYNCSSADDYKQAKESAILRHRKSAQDIIKLVMDCAEKK